MFSSEMFRMRKGKAIEVYDGYHSIHLSLERWGHLFKKQVVAAKYIV